MMDGIVTTVKNVLAKQSKDLIIWASPTESKLYLEKIVRFGYLATQSVEKDYLFVGGCARKKKTKRKYKLKIIKKCIKKEKGYRADIPYFSGNPRIFKYQPSDPL